MEKAFICPEGHSLLVDENISMTGRCPICNTDYPMYLLTPDRKVKEVKTDKAPAKKAAPATKKTQAKPKSKAASKPKTETKPALTAAEKPIELPATASKAAPAAKKPAAKKTCKKKKK